MPERKRPGTIQRLRATRTMLVLVLHRISTHSENIICENTYAASRIMGRTATRRTLQKTIRLPQMKRCRRRNFAVYFASLSLPGRISTSNLMQANAYKTPSAPEVDGGGEDLESGREPSRRFAVDIEEHFARTFDGQRGHAAATYDGHVFAR